MSPNIDLAAGPSLLDPRMKMSWAKRHLCTLYEEIGKFVEQKDSYSIVREDDLEAGEHVIKIDIAPMSAELGLIAGDFVCSLRSALDHIAWQLSLLTKEPRNKWLSFPIIDSDNAEGQKAFQRVVSSIPSDAIKVIDGFQPYKHGPAYKSTHLWKLHRLWNIDKHRRIPFHGNIVHVNISYPKNVTATVTSPHDKSVVRFPISAKPYINFEPTVDINIVFGDESEDIFVAATDLVDIYNFVNGKVYTAFKSFF